MSNSYEHVLIEDQSQWRAWLDANHGTSPGIWLVTWKKASGRPLVPYDVIVDQALAYGWVDSRPRSIDEHRSARLLTPRRAASNWSARNKARVEQLTTDGRMHPAGLAAVAAAAKANGAWTALDETETLTEPADLAAALDATPGARRYWNAFPRSARRASSNGSPTPRPAPPARLASSAPPPTPPATFAPTSGGSPPDAGTQPGDPPQHTRSLANSNENPRSHQHQRGR